MEIGKQIKKLRTDYNFSQDELAEQIHVSRQTISNWENDKCYPDVESLLLMSNLFHTTLDGLVKGDIETMKHEIEGTDIRRFGREGNIFGILFVCTIVLPIPLDYFFGYVGWGIWGVIAALAIYYAIKVEKLKKNFDVQTYKEILAFVQGKQLDNNEKNQERGKRPYQKAVLALGAAVSAVIIAIIIGFLLR